MCNHNIGSLTIFGLHGIGLILLNTTVVLQTQGHRHGPAISDIQNYLAGLLLSTSVSIAVSKPLSLKPYFSVER